MTRKRAHFISLPKEVGYLMIIPVQLQISMLCCIVTFSQIVQSSLIIVLVLIYWLRFPDASVVQLSQTEPI